MKSFQLDPDSLDEVVKGWPVLVVALLLGSVIASFTQFHPWARILIPSALGLVLGIRMIPQLWRNHPTARHIWLLAIGMIACLVEAVLNIAFPRGLDGDFHFVWLVIAFVSLLAFAVVNRKNRDVVQ
ncbi:hypothetical protein [Rubinisphaera margarita]|uniref:hypothetical protein n=1 Tax=Rubinisphaera margarita TaxID=2909586 RepID=UPI001EE87FD4|nr:hypothetical protein [Rubinisphaera margarita]MCG6156519.1 hypothetical protein [Rubinisphaera margarita]